MVSIEELLLVDLEHAISLWISIPELRFAPEFDTKDRLSRFLERNHGLSTIAKADGKIVGALLCGHDGRRGFIYHTGVNPLYRKQNIASQMVQRSFSALRKEHIDTCFLFTNDFNEGAQLFWKSQGFEYAPHVMYHSKAI